MPPECTAASATLLHYAALLRDGSDLIATRASAAQWYAGGMRWHGAAAAACWSNLHDVAAVVARCTATLDDRAALLLRLAG
jgi:hypothetical protein